MMGAKTASLVLWSVSLLVSVPASLGQTSAQSEGPSPKACESEAHRAFDFWVGKWDVYKTGEGKIVAHSLIESLYDGCAIRENWMPLKGQAGGSISNYDEREQGWHQTWVDASGTRVEFTGGYADGKMILTGLWRDVAGPGQDGLIRMTYSRLPEGAVRQLGELSQDAGGNWKPAFDFTYRPANME